MEDKEIKALVNLPMPRKQLVLRIKSICSKQVKNVVQQNSNKYHIYYRCKQTASYIEQLDDLDLSRIEFPQKDENGNFRLQIARADDHYLDTYRKLSLDQINQVLCGILRELHFFDERFYRLYERIKDVQKRR